jgi:hypothetical protein
MCLRRVFISTCSAMARARLAEGPREHCGKCGGRARQPGGNSQGICGSCLQHSLAAAATHRPAQALAASPLAMAAPIRRKAPREHRGKCSGRARQPRGPLTGCLWDVPPASACRGSRTPPRSGACHLLSKRPPPKDNATEKVVSFIIWSSEQIYCWKKYGTRYMYLWHRTQYSRRVINRLALSFINARCRPKGAGDVASCLPCPLNASTKQRPHVGPILRKTGQDPRAKCQA